MIVVNAIHEQTVRVNDSFLIDCSRSLCFDGSQVDTISIIPESGADTIEIFNNQTELEFGETVEDTKDYIWLYKTPGVKELTVIVTKGEDSEQETYSITVLSKEDDVNFSNDNDLRVHESKIDTFLRTGKTSFINLHREVKAEILRDINSKYKDIEFENIFNKNELIAWSKYRVLELIYESDITNLDDLHIDKRNTYKDLVSTAKSQAVILLDTDLNGEADKEVKRHNIGLRLT